MWTKDELESYFENNSENLIYSEQDPFYLSSTSDCFELMKIPLSKVRSIYGGLGASPESWVEWFDGEIRTWENSHGGDNRWLDLEKYYLENLEELPPTLFEGVDGYFYLDDGHHRTAILYKNAFQEMVAVVRKIPLETNRK